MNVSGKVLKPWLQHDGRYYIRITDDKGVKSNSLLMNRLVAMAFLGVPPKDYECDHMDRDKVNNRADNLQWISPSEHKLKSANETGSRITLENIHNNNVYQFGTRAEAARELGISYSSVLSIAKGNQVRGSEYRLVA